jgi:hypothetical protein
VRALWLLTVAVAATLVGASAAAVSASAAKTICVGNKIGCYPTLQAGLNAVNDGDTVKILAGTYSGGVTASKSVSLLGAGSGATVIEGGGPVLTIGQAGAANEPTVLIQGVTITGGVNGSVPATDRAKGGGIWVPPNAAGDGGATVTIRNSVITGNSVAPTSAGPSPSGVICPGGAFCPFALAAGGGIYNDGTMTLENTVVSDNTAGSAAGVASDAEGGGIHTNSGSLTLLNSAIRNNNAVGVAPDGRFAEGGGIFMSENTQLTIRNSTVGDNSTVLSATFPHPYPEQGGGTDSMASNGGGIHTSDGGSTTIANSHLDGNTITVSDPNGEPVGFDAALCTCGENSLTLTNSTANGNKVIATVGSQADVGPSGPAAMEFDGPATITNTRITGNSTTVTSPDGAAEALGAVGGFQISPDTATITNTVISGNTVTASSTTGSATAQGDGLTNDGVLLLANDQITHNKGTASAPTGSSQGGGIFNGVIFGAPPVQLNLQNTNVTGNTLLGNPGITLQGGGLYTPGFPTTSTNSHITNNTPDQCYGC